MDVEVKVNAADAQFIFVRLDDDLVNYVVQVADVEIHGLPRWALEDLRARIVETLERKPPARTT